MTIRIGVALALTLSSALGAQVPAGAAARNAASIEHLLRPVVRVAGQPDAAFDIAERMRYWHVPGVSVAIIDNFQIVYARGFGVTEFGGGVPVDTTTLFLAGSISKPVFATGAMRLVQDGRLSLDDDVNGKLKSWRLPDSKFTEKEKVTLRRLLSHTAGLTVWGFPGYEAGKPVPTVPQVLDGAAPANTDAVRNDTTPGARWLYSGGGITIAQLLTTDVTGEAFPALMKRLVLAPVGMTRSTYENPLPASRHREAATGHERIDTPVPGHFHTYPEMAAAGLWTTASDLARWAIALSHSYNGQGGILSRASAREMISRQGSPAQQYGGGAYGLGIGVENEGTDSVAFSHGGRDEGFVATVRMWPTLGRGYVVLTNGVSGSLLNEITRAFAEVYGTGARPRQERAIVAIDSAAARSLAGRYVSVQRTDTLAFDLTTHGNEVMMYSHLGKRSWRLWPEARDTLFDANSGQAVVVERDPSGAVTALRLGKAPGAPKALRRTD